MEGAHCSFPGAMPRNACVPGHTYPDHAGALGANGIAPSLGLGPPGTAVEGGRTQQPQLLSCTCLHASLRQHNPTPSPVCQRQGQKGQEKAPTMGNARRLPPGSACQAKSPLTRHRALASAQRSIRLNRSKALQRTKQQVRKSLSDLAREGLSLKSIFLEQQGAGQK